MSAVAPCCGDIATLDELVETLNLEFEDLQTEDLVARVKNVMSRYQANHDEWSKFCIYDPYRYTRNLVEKNAHYVLMLLCWGPNMQR